MQILSVHDTSIQTANHQYWSVLIFQCLGNHDFDLGLEVLVPYLNNITAEIVTANMDISREPSLQGLVKRSTVLVRGGEKIGIVGVTTKDTSFLSSAGKRIH